MIYNVEITETLQRTLSINVESEDEAYEIAKRMFRECEVVLDSSDYIDTEFAVLGINRV
jgi:hypothetical protein